MWLECNKDVCMEAVVAFLKLLLHHLVTIAFIVEKILLPEIRLGYVTF